MTIDVYDTDLDWVAEIDMALESGPLDIPPDVEQANRMLRQLGRARSELAEIDEAFQTEIDKLEARRDDLTAGPAIRATALEDTLVSYGLAVRDKTGAKKVNMPHGTISTKAGTTSVDVTDADLFINWWEDTEQVKGFVVQPDLPPRQIAKNPIKAAIKAGLLQVDDNGNIIVPSTGEMLPGIQLVTGATTAKVVLP